jgi:flagellin-like hook-associated protein FlgL
MRELAVQSANDSNTDADRFELQSEIKSLKDELDRIGNSTEFNTRKLLEGSARGDSDEIPGTVRINNNSSIVIDSLKFDALAKSVEQDKSWAFDGAYMLLKTNQSNDSNLNKVYNANDFKLIGPDGKTYDFRELSPYTTIDPGYLEPGTIIAATGVESEFKEGAVGSDTFLGYTVPSGGFDEKAVTVIGAKSVLADGSKIVFDTTALNSGGSVSKEIGLSGGIKIRFIPEDTSVPTDAVFEIDLNDGNGYVSVSGSQTYTIDEESFTLDFGAATGTFAVTSGPVTLVSGLDAASVTRFSIAEGSILSYPRTVYADPEAIETLGLEPGYGPPGAAYPKGVTLAQNADEKIVTEIGAGSLLATGSSVTLFPGNSLKLDGYLADALKPGLEIKFNEAVPAVPASGIAAIPQNFSVTINGEKMEISEIRNVTLNDGTTLELNPFTGAVTVKTGEILLKEPLVAIFPDPITPSYTSYKLAAGTFLSATSVAAEGTISIQANNVLLKGELSDNVTLGNSIRLTEADVPYLKEGTVLAKGSDITILPDVILKLSVRGAEVDLNFDDTRGALRVNGEVVAPGKTITLDDGTELINRGGGKVEVLTGRITLSRDLNPDTESISHNIISYSIAKDSTLVAGTKIAAGTVLEAGTVFSERGSHPFAGSVTLGLEGRSLQFSANPGNGLEARYYETEIGAGMTFIFSRYEPASEDPKNSLVGQIGANTGEITFVAINDMRARALGVADIDISTKWGAATGIETINNALQRVSHQRATLGATQNRLEHTIKNLDTTAENVQAAESRIRDIDMAREVVENTRQSILQQASQAMLAQANQVPQNVLQLLRG